MTSGVGPTLTVERPVIAEMVRLAALEVPGVLRLGRGGPAWRNGLAGPPVKIRIEDGRVGVRVWIVARPGALIGPLAGQIRRTVGGAIERLLGLEVGAVTIVVDGVGG